MGIITNLIRGVVTAGARAKPIKSNIKISDRVKNRYRRPKIDKADIPIKNFETGTSPEFKASPLHAQQESFYKKRIALLTKEKPYAIDQLNYVQKSLDDLPAKDLAKVSTYVNKAIDSLDDVHIKKAYHAVKRKQIAKDLYEAFTGTDRKFNKGNTLARMKSLFNGAEQGSVNASLIFENKLVVGLREKGTQHTDAFKLLYNNPDKFADLYGVNQDQIFIELIEGSGKYNDVPIVGDIINILKKADIENITGLQKAGVPIGQIKGFALGMEIPDSFAQNTTKDQFLQAFESNTKVTDFSILEDLYDSLISRTSLHNADDTLAFLSRKMKFKSAAHELQFYKTVNGIHDQSFLTSDILRFKKRSIKKALLQSSFGDNPSETFKDAIDNVKTLKGGKDLDTNDFADLKDLEGWFDRHYSALRGDVNITHKTIEDLGDALSSLVSATTGALGGSFIRNALFDFIANYGAAKQAIYNPRTGIGASAFETFKSFFDVINTGLLSAESKKQVGTLLDIMQVASMSDAIGVNNLSTFESAIESVGRGSSQKSNQVTKLSNALRALHSKVYSWTGSDHLLDNRRATHLIKLQRLWSNTLDSVASYEDYIKSFVDPVDVKQVGYLNTKFGIGKKEFELLKRVGRQKTNGKVLGLTVPDSITPDSILNSVGIASKSELQDLSHKWRVFLHNSLLDAAPITTNADSVTIESGLFNATSGMRLVLRPIFKFADVSQSQFNGVIERVALNSYGNRGTDYGLSSGKSHFAYAKALMAYTGGSIGISWAKDYLQGREYTDYTNFGNIGRAAVFSGWGGFPLQVFTGSFSSNRGGSGFFGNAPIAKVGRDLSKVYEGVAEGLLEGDNIKIYKGAYALGGFTGLTSMWYLKGVMQTAFKHALLSKPERREVEKQINTYRFPDRNKKSRGGFGN